MHSRAWRRSCPSASDLRLYGLDDLLAEVVIDALARVAAVVPFGF
ncbi:MAG TPA: hypothetical protein VNR62_11595 [Cellulomonas sp.]|nr:hypothetical protein [Cellulomonas sp.]